MNLRPRDADRIRDDAITQIHLPPTAPMPPQQRRARPPWARGGRLSTRSVLVALLVIILAGGGIGLFVGHITSGHWFWQGAAPIAIARPTPTPTGATPQPTAPQPTTPGASATVAATAAPAVATCSAAGVGEAPATTGIDYLVFPFLAGASAASAAPDADHQGYQTRTLTVCQPNMAASLAQTMQHDHLATAGWVATRDPSPALDECGTDCWMITLHGPPDYVNNTKVYAGLSAVSQRGAVSLFTLTLTVAPYASTILFAGTIPLDIGSTGDIKVTAPDQFITVGNTGYAPVPAGQTADTITCATLSNLPFTQHRDGSQRSPITVTPMSLIALKSNQTHWIFAQFSYTSQGLQMSWFGYPFCLT